MPDEPSPIIFARVVRDRADRYNDVQTSRPFGGHFIAEIQLSSGFTLRLPTQQNAIGHAWASAFAAYTFGDQFSSAVGTLNEWAEAGTNAERRSLGNPYDEYSDHWNNSVGRQIGDWARQQALPPHAIDFLVRYALEHGALTGVTHDSHDRATGWNRIPAPGGAPLSQISPALLQQAISSPWQQGHTRFV